MVPARYNMEIFKGGTFTIDFSGKFADGLPLDFSAYDTISFRVLQPWIHTQDVDSIPLLELDGSSFVITAVGTIISLTIDASVTEAFSFTDGRYFFDLITTVVDGEDIVDKFLYGKFVVIGPEDI